MAAAGARPQTSQTTPRLAVATSYRDGKWDPHFRLAECAYVLLFNKQQSSDQWLASYFLHSNV